MSFQDSEWKVKVEEVLGVGSVKVWIYRSVREGTIEVAHFDKGGYIKVVEVSYPDSPEIAPTMVIPYMAYDALIGAIQHAKPIKEKQVVDAELTATKYHLEDMRKLVFNPSVEITGASHE